MLGANVDPVRLMVETSSSELPASASGDPSDADATALSARWIRGRFRPGVAWVVPSDFVDELANSIFVFSLQVVTGDLD